MNGTVQAGLAATSSTRWWYFTALNSPGIILEYTWRRNGVHETMRTKQQHGDALPKAPEPQGGVFVQEAAECLGGQQYILQATDTNTSPCAFAFAFAYDII